MDCPMLTWLAANALFETSIFFIEGTNLIYYPLWDTLISFGETICSVFKAGPGKTPSFTNILAAFTNITAVELPPL